MSKRLLCITMDFPPNLGGVAHYWKRVVLSLNSSGHHTTVLTSTMTKSDLDASVEIKHQSLFFSRIRPRWVKAIFVILKEVRSKKYDAILVDQIWPMGVATFLVTRLKNIPYVVQLHGNDYLQSRHSKIKTWLIRLAFNHAKAILVNSASTKSLIEGDVKEPQKIHIIWPIPEQYPLVDESLALAMRQKHHIDEQDPVILFVGRLVERKGAQQLMGAMTHIWQQAPSTHLVIIGDGPMRKVLERMPQSNDRRVKLLGSLARDEVMQWMRGATIFCMPTMKFSDDIEGFGMVYLEAYAQKTPVVGGRSGGEVDAIEAGKSGVFVESENIDDIAERIITLLLNPADLHQMGEYAYDLLSSRYDLGKTI